MKAFKQSKNDIITGIVFTAFIWYLIYSKSDKVKKMVEDVKDYIGIPWAKKAGPDFTAKAKDISNKLGIKVDWLLSCIAFETGETFSASIVNIAGSGAIGLIQFMPSTAKALGTSTAELAKMNPVKQLDYVYKYFLPYKGKLNSLDDVYLAILYPAAIGKPKNYALFRKDDNSNPKLYLQNRGFDVNKDGLITIAEITSAVNKKMQRGYLPQFLLN